MFANVSIPRMEMACPCVARSSYNAFFPQKSVNAVEMASYEAVEDSYTKSLPVMN